ncbi:MAG TPA: YqcC family protein [Actinomycetota bacterium]
MTNESKRVRLGELADDIEAEMRRLGAWMENPPTEETVLGGGAFGMGTVAFDTWLQVVFVPRLRQTAAGAFPLPKNSSVGAQASREWDGETRDLERLLGLILDVDDVIEGRGSGY